ncbi:MAG: diguanylate cyclase [Gammaproteobacteria bacterium]
MIRNDLSIVLVDDMPLFCEAACVLLESIGYLDVRSAYSAKQALVLLAERPADVVITDWNMPEMDGLELTRHVRQVDEDINHYTSIIMVTANENLESMLLAFQHGIDDYMTKPLRKQELAARLHAAGRIADLQNRLIETAQSLDAHNKELQELATTDPLTGLGNRRYLQTHLDAILAETMARGGVTCLALIDLDHFKVINDTHGHGVGDEVLLAFAKRLHRAARPTDIVARMGGEEFAVIMHYPKMNRCNVEAFERILHDISQYPIKTTVGDIFLTASLGICDYVGGEGLPTPDALINCADIKLYQAKAQGRNRVVF